MVKRIVCSLLLVCIGIGLGRYPANSVFASELTRLHAQSGDIQPGDVVINEVSVKGAEWVELYNPTDKTISLEGWYIDDKKCGRPSNPVGAVTLAPGDYYMIEAFKSGWSLNRLSGDGELLRLCESHHGEIDYVAYGILGGAPVPPSGYSTARTPNGYDSGDDARDWNLDPTPTKGKANDTPGTAMGSALLINEVNNHPQPAKPAIELYNPLSTPVAIAGWIISDGDQWGAIEEDTMAPAGGLVVIHPTDYGVTVKKDDVLYLFRPDGVRVDQIGFSYSDWDYTFQRVPNGAGPSTGYDWTSSEGGHTWLYLPESLGRVNIPLEGPPGGTVQWAQDRIILGRLMQDFEDADDVCITADIVLAAVAAGFNPADWKSSQGHSLLEQFHTQAKSAADAQELSCVILASVATWQDPRAFDGRDLVAALKLTQNAQTGQFGDDLRTHAYALLALRNSAEPIPSSAVARLRELRVQDGGWAHNGATTPRSADVTTTALVVQALFGAGESDMAYGAFEYLHRMQNQAGGFNLSALGADGIATDAEATALTLQALRVVNETMGRWTPHGTDPIGALLAAWIAANRGYVDNKGKYDLQTTARAVQVLEGMQLVDVRQK